MNINQQWRSKMIKKIIYTAGVIIEDVEVAVPNKYSNFFMHHMTIQFGFDGVALPDYIGNKFNFHVDAEYSDDKAIALSGHIDNEEIAKVMDARNQHAHITVATVDGVKPVYSNELLMTGNRNEVNLDTIKMKAGAFVVFEDDTTGWVFEK